MKAEKVVLGEEFGDYAGEYVLSELSWAKRNRIIQKHTTYSPVTGEVAKSDAVSIQAENIWYSLRGRKPQKSPLTLERLLDETEDGVPVEVGERLGIVANKLNGLSRIDVRFLLGQLSESERTQLLQSFGYAKNSGGPSQL